MAENTPGTSFFSRENYIWMAAGLALIIIGMILMVGGKSDNPAVFNPKEVYGSQRITVAPVMIFLGLIVEIYAIFKRPKA
jgi:hypothetical protein